MECAWEGSSRPGERWEEDQNDNIAGEEWIGIPDRAKQHALPEVNGFINYNTKGIGSIDNSTTLIHEWKPLVEENFHQPGGHLEAEYFSESAGRKHEEGARGTSPDKRLGRASAMETY